MKVHISLVGRQAAPVYNGIVAVKPTKVVLVYSHESKDAADAVLREQLPYQIEPIGRPLSPTDPVEIRRYAEAMAEKFKADEVTVNISGGPKSWTYFFTVAFASHPNAAIVYMDQNSILWNYRTMSGTGDFLFDMDTLFRLYGNPLGNFVRHSEYSESDRMVLPRIVSARKFAHIEFNKLAILESGRENTLNSQPKGKFKTDNGSEICWERPRGGREANVSIALTKSGHRKEYYLSSPHVIGLVFNSGWFEFTIAEMLSHWKKAKDIRMNCIFPFDKKIAKNEVDILVNIGSKMLFVECKTQVRQTTDIDKFRTVVIRYGGTASKALFITDEPMPELAKNKCKESGIISFSLKDNHMGMENEDALFFLLDSEMNNLNA